MRDVYQEQLDDLADSLAGMCDTVAEAMEKATRSLLECDLHLAEEVITDDTGVDDLRASAEEKAFALLALQAPVATDLRIVVSAIHGAGDIERMGDLALHVAQAARRRHPQPVLPEEVAPYFAEMGRVGVALAHKAGEVIRTRDLARAAELETDDD
ncbi:phosphate transport system regulatory protein PhoU, partial [Pseudonocardia sp. CNS-139]